MRRKRIVLGTAGLLLITFGVARLLIQVPFASLLWVAVWLMVAVAVHDGVLAPATVGAGLLLGRIPPRARRFVQGGLVVGAMVTVIAVPLILRRGTQPAVKAILQRDYAGGLGLLLGLIAAVAAIAYLITLLRDRSKSTPDPSPDDERLP